MDHGWKKERLFLPGCVKNSWNMNRPNASPRWNSSTVAVERNFTRFLCAEGVSWLNSIKPCRMSDDWPFAGAHLFRIKKTNLYHFSTATQLTAKKYGQYSTQTRRAACERQSAIEFA